MWPASSSQSHPVTNFFQPVTSCDQLLPASHILWPGCFNQSRPVTNLLQPIMSYDSKLFHFSANHLSKANNLFHFSANHISAVTLFQLITSCDQPRARFSQTYLENSTVSRSQSLAEWIVFQKKYIPRWLSLELEINIKYLLMMQCKKHAFKIHSCSKHATDSKPGRLKEQHSRIIWAVVNCWQAEPQGASTNSKISVQYINPSLKSPLKQSFLDNITLFPNAGEGAVSNDDSLLSKVLST